MDYIALIVGQFEALPTPQKLIIGLLILMSIDIASGLLAAGREWRLSSKIGRTGVTRKALTLIGVCTAAVVQLILNDLPVTAEFPSALILSSVVGWYCVIEFLSIVENFRRAGVYIPVLTPLAQRFADIARAQGLITASNLTVTSTNATLYVNGATSPSATAAQSDAPPASSEAAQ
jgi:toxin secretion/phage lysis holin